MRGKHIPRRTCVGCRQVFPKHELIRVVRTPEGNIAIDEQGKSPGRGAYLCRQKSCWDIAIDRSKLANSLKTSIDETTRAYLQEYALGLEKGA